MEKLPGMGSGSGVNGPSGLSLAATPMRKIPTRGYVSDADAPRESGVRCSEATRVLSPLRHIGTQTQGGSAQIDTLPLPVPASQSMVPRYSPS